MDTRPHPQITLHHLHLAGEQKIGLQFSPDALIHAPIKEQLPHARWSKAHAMVTLPNSGRQLKQLFAVFRGDIWIDCKRFFLNPRTLNNQPLQEAGPDEKKSYPPVTIFQAGKDQVVLRHLYNREMSHSLKSILQTASYNIQSPWPVWISVSQIIC